MELRIREFQKQDMDALYFLDQSCYPPEQRSSYKALLDVLLDRDCAALVAEEIGEDFTRVIAVLIVLGDPWRSRLFIVSLMVKYEFRRLGIARRLLDWAERLARGFRCNTLLVRSPEGYGLGEVFLTANGFTAGRDEKGDAPGGKQGVLWMREVSHGEKESGGEGHAKAAGKSGGGEGQTETAGEGGGETAGEGGGETAGEGGGETAGEGDSEGQTETAGKGGGEGQAETAGEGDSEGQAEGRVEAADAGDGEGGGETAGEGDSEGQGEGRVEGAGEGDGE